jgi:hypothetical protein
VFIAYRNIGIILGFSAIFLVFTSNLAMNMNSEHFLQGAPFKFDKKGASKFVKKLKERIKNQIEDQRDNNKKDDVKKKKVVKREASVNYDYNFAGEGDNKRKNFNFAAVGDFGCSKNAEKTVSNIKGNKPELVLPLGDLSYDRSANCWLDLISPFSNKLSVTLGFHDVNDGLPKLNQYEKAFDFSKPYGSYDYRHVHFLSIASESQYQAGSAQYNFISEDLKKASENKDIDWIVVTSYGPFYTSPSTHKAEKVLRDIYHPIFEKYGVDLVLQAHNHNYQRTYPISYNSAGDSSNPIVSNQVTTGYNNDMKGAIFAVVGTGGESFYPLASQAPYVATQFDGKFGFLNIDISNGNPHTKLTGTFYDNRDGNIADQFTIEKEIKNKDGDIQPDTQSASHASQNSNSDSNSNSNRDYLPSYNYNDK